MHAFVCLCANAVRMYSSYGSGPTHFGPHARLSTPTCTHHAAPRGLVKPALCPRRAPSGRVLVVDGVPIKRNQMMAMQLATQYDEQVRLSPPSPLLPPPPVPCLPSL